MYTGFSLPLLYCLYNGKNFDLAHLSILLTFGVVVLLIPERAVIKTNEKWLRNTLSKKSDSVDLWVFPLLSVHARIAKRIFDVIFSFWALIVLSPVYLFIAILIKLDSKGPVLYKPVRVGFLKNVFVLYKFRTMYCNDDALLGTKSTVKDDPRITTVGKFLRKYSLDELPQFLNSLLGDMSVVGPRPHRITLHERMRREIEGYRLREYIKPGITGWAQVNGWRGPTQTRKQLIKRTSHDLWYIMNWSLALDLRIIFLTIFGGKVRVNAF